ncbi:hypothetical protein DPEC_G00363770 [Dallia pectoralis]|nr:hypothetical protein DPEC_G00363770 [Dallia pectoralis]
MVGHNEYYGSYWWINNKNDWLTVTLIAAPALIVFGLVLVTHRICSVRLSKMHKPCSPWYNPVYCDRAVLVMSLIFTHIGQMDLVELTLRPGATRKSKVIPLGD